MHRASFPQGAIAPLAAAGAAALLAGLVAWLGACGEAARDELADRAAAASAEGLGARARGADSAPCAGCTFDVPPGRGPAPRPRWLDQRAPATARTASPDRR